MKLFVNKIKIRWKAAPTWVKAVDISCWTILVLLLIMYFK